MNKKETCLDGRERNVDEEPGDKSCSSSANKLAQREINAVLNR